MKNQTCTLILWISSVIRGLDDWDEDGVGAGKGRCVKKSVGGGG